MAEYCKKCGALLTVGLVYCVNCGEPVANVDEGPDTVVRHEFPLTQTVENNVDPAPPDQRVTWPIVVASIAAACAVVAIAVLFYLLGHQAALRESQLTRDQSNTVNEPPQPILSPTPTLSPTPPPIVQRDSTGPTDCMANEKAQLHDDCDLKDCDTDASTVAFGISAGTPVTKLGLSKQSRKYRWEKITVNGRETWIASTKLDCTPLAGSTAPGSPANITPATNRSNRTVAADPWRGVPADVRAICNDGTFSYTGTRLFQCAFHKGVRVRR